MNSVHRFVIFGRGVRRPIRRQSPKNAPVQVTVLDRRNFHLFQPLLYQVATGALSPGAAAEKQQMLLSEATDLDAERRSVIMDELPDGRIRFADCRYRHRPFLLRTRRLAAERTRLEKH
jgi:NADH:ubiquinone reductase (H+-translocating)